MEFATRRRSEQTKTRARLLRHADNIAEALLWDELKARKLSGYNSCCAKDETFGRQYSPRLKDGWLRRS